MAIFGKYFTYNGRSSEEFGLIIAGFQNVDTPLGLARDWSQSSMNKYRHRVNTYGVNYNDTLSFKIQLIKDPCTHLTDNDMRLSRDDVRRITAWLTSPITPRLFHMYDFPNITYEVVPKDDEDEDADNTNTGDETGDETGNNTNDTDNVTDDGAGDEPDEQADNEPEIIEIDNGEEEYDYMGLFTNITAQDNRIYCLDCTFECNTPYALSYENSVLIQNGEGVVNNLSDDYEDYVYPVIKIFPTEDINEPYSIRLINETDGNRSITLNNMKYRDMVTMDCQKMTVKNASGSLISFEDLNVDVVDYIYWFRLLPGENQIKVVGDADVTFIFRYPVKVGAY